MRQTYAQEWPAYNQAQVNEKSRFLELLFELCKGIEEPPQTFGRPRLPFADMLFCVAYKIYSGVSSRRFSSDLRDAMQKGFIASAPHFNSVSNYLEDDFGVRPELRGKPRLQSIRDAGAVVPRKRQSGDSGGRRNRNNGDYQQLDKAVHIHSARYE